MLSFECIKNEKSVYFLLTSAPPRGSLLGSKVQHRGKAAQTKPENITEGKEAAHSPHSKWRRKLFYEECNTKNISVNAGYINDSCK